MEVITIKNVSKIYTKKNKKIIALDNINYTFYKGKLYSIMGNSGSGKSTLISIICGLITPTMGNIIYFNKKIKGDTNLSKMRNEEIGLIYQSFLLNENMTALENVLLPTYILKTKNNYFIAKQKLIDFGLENRMNHYPKELSGGEQQRVAIARAIINDPTIILADEPTGNLDKKNEEFVFKMLRNMADEGKCVIVVSHNELILKYSDISLELKEGKLYEKK